MLLGQTVCQDPSNYQSRQILDLLGIYLQLSFGSGRDVQITTDTSGKYVYLILTDSTGAIKVFYSSNFAINWTQITGASFGDGVFPVIATDHSGEHVYIAWRDGPDTVHIFFSSNFGVFWAETASALTIGWDPQVITSASGKHVYASWWKPLAEKTQIFYSKDFGATWINADPLETIFGDGVFPQLTTDLSGQYVSDIWADRLLGLPNIKIFYSKDFGVTWRESTDSFGAGDDASIISNDSGRYVFAVWRDNDPIGDIKIFYSKDFGATWTDTTGSFGQGAEPVIITNHTGRNVFAIWQDNFPTGNIKTFYSSDFGATWNDVDSSDTFFGIGEFPNIISDNVAQNIYGLWKSSVSFTKGIRSFFPLTLMKDKRL
ncbi:MAG: hypothetical protein K1000chlam1_00403 [Candidatus Anoxychlamydiales bacterium]|nr:hypothetical protein [Candidatus Anoxychlamydiales bacterium]